MHNLTIAELIHGLQSKQFSSVELTQHFLTRIAELTGGKIFNVKEEPEELAQAAQDVTRIEDKRDKPLWDNALVLIAMLSLFGAEWSIRRQRGFV